MGGRPTEHLETELKFDVDPEFTVPDLSGVAGGVVMTGPEIRLLAAHYFDTSDLRLAGARITLRRRTGGPDAGWHLKLPLGGGTRREMQLPLDDRDQPGREAEVPPQLRELVSTVVRDQPLRVVALLETRRTVRYLDGADGQTRAEVADDQVTGQVPGQPGAPAEPVTWREVEVELVSGDPAILAAARSRLLAAGARPSSSASKLGRLLGTANSTGSSAPNNSAPGGTGNTRV
jgi:inorganic triphosphatase YgiF